MIETTSRSTRGQAALQRSGPLEWWYRLTAPAEPPTTASLAQREVARRGRLTSMTLLFMGVVLILPIPVALIGRNYAIFTAIMITLLFNGVALFLNRLGKRVAAGVLFVTVLDVGFMLSLLTTPGGLDVTNLPTFDLLTEALLVSVAFFPPWTIFVVLLVNSVFILLDLVFQPHALALGNYLTVNAYDVLVRPIILQIIVAGVTYLWVRSATDAIVRADRAEEIAELEHREIERQQREIEEKQQLDMGIQQILQTHVQVANGNFSARAPLSKDNVLWQIAYSLNNLLARLQGYSQVQVQLQRLQAENYHLHNTVQSTLSAQNELQRTREAAASAQNELQRTREAAARLVEALKQSRSGRMAPLSLQSGTIIDSVVMQLSNSAPLSGEKQAFPSGRTRAEGKGI